MTLTISNLDYADWGSKKAYIADVAFDSSYAIGGEALVAGDVGLETIQKLLIEPCQGYTFEYDYTNETIKVFQLAPPIVHEEVVTITTYTTGYLKWPAAHIEYISDGSDPFMVIPGGLTPVQKSCAVDMGFSLTTGVLTKGQRTSLTFHASDTLTSVYVSYITQAWKEVTDNMVQACLTSGERTYGHADLSFAAASPDVMSMGEDMVAVQSVTWNDGGTIIPMTALKDDATLGTGKTECIIDFRTTTTYAEIAFHASDEVDTTDDVVYVTYIRDPGAGTFLYDRFTNAEIVDA